MAAEATNQNDSRRSGGRRRRERQRIRQARAALAVKLGLWLFFGATLVSGGVAVAYLLD